MSLRLAVMMMMMMMMLMIDLVSKMDVDSFIDDSAKIDDGKVDNGNDEEIEDLLLLEKDKTAYYGSFVDDVIDDKSGDEDISMNRQLDNDRACIAAVNLLEASTADLMSSDDDDDDDDNDICVDKCNMDDDDRNVDIGLSDGDLSTEEIRIRDIVNKLSVEVSRNVHTDLKVHHPGK